MAQLQISLFGPFQVTLDGAPVTGFESDKARALLAYLAVETDCPHRREVLAGLLWPDTPERTARTNLRSALANIRQVIDDHQADPPFLLTTHQTIQFNRASNARLDVDVLADAVRETLSTDIPTLHEAVDLYQGQFLAGFYIQGTPLFEEWVLITRESLQRQAMHAMHRLTTYFEGTGATEQALQLAQRQVDLEPYQETAHQQVMLMLALNGQRNEALVHYDRFRTLLESELGVAPLDQTQEMYARLVDGELPGSPTNKLVLRREPRLVGECPYRGLAAFREADAPYFYGREAFTEYLDECIQKRSMSVIVGSSGTGKSSAVFAGLLPRLQDDWRWLLTDLRPSSDPFSALASALSPAQQAGLKESDRWIETQKQADALREGELTLSELVEGILENSKNADRLLLFIDQFEELYTRCPVAGLRRRFLDVLLDAVATGEDQQGSPLGLVLTLRADFMGQALAYRSFADALNDHSLILGPMDQAELRAAIEEPAQKQGAAFEPGLVTRILNDIGAEPGNLPLLEFALTLLWEQLDQGWLTHVAYEEIGQVGGALARYAEDVFLALEESQRGDAQRIFIQLVQPGRGTEDTRRLGTRSEMGDERWNLIQHLADKRLVVTGQEEGGRQTVEIIHEALIREWSRLRDWIDSDRDFRVWQENLRTTLRQWEDSDRNLGALLHGVALSKAETWLIERIDDLSKAERWFIQASLAEQRDRQKAETIRQAREKTLERRSRLFLQVMVIVLLLATGISIGFVLVARKEARQAIKASSLSLSANARQALSDGDSTSALVLALAANRIADPPLESERTLLEAAFSPGPRKLYTVNELSPGVEGPPLSVAISPKGNTVLTGYFDGSIVLWDIATGTEIRRLTGHSPGDYDPSRIAIYSGINDIDFSPNGLMAISGGDDGIVILWEIETGEEIRRFEGHSGAVRTVAISPDGFMAISGGLSGTVRTDPGELILWDLKTGQEIRRFEGHTEVVIDISFILDGRRVLASSGEVDYSETPFQTYSLILWDVATGEVIHRFEGIDRDIPGLAISPDDSLALTGSTDHNLYLWDMETGEQILAIKGHADLVRVVKFSPDGRRAISGGGDGEVILWNLEKGELLARFNVHAAGVNDIAFTPDGRTALSVGTDGAIIQWDLFNAAQINRFEGHEGAVLDVAYAPNGKHFVSASGLFDPAAPIIEEDSLRLWNLESGAQSGTLDWHLSDIFQIAVSPDGRRVLSGQMVDQSVRLWDFATGQEIRRFEGHMAPVLSVAFTPEGRRGLSGGADSQIILWNLETGEEIRRFTGHEGGIWALAVSPDGRTILSGADDRLVIWWNLETGEEIRRFVGHNETVSGVAFSPDGIRAISGDTEGPLIEWDLETGEEIQRFAGHTGTGPIGRTRVAFGPDGETIISSGWDGTLALWGLGTGKEIHRFRGHDTDFIFDIAISPDGQTALSCGTDQTIIQWQIDIPSLDELLEWISLNRYVRELTCEERDLYQIEPLCSP